MPFLIINLPIGGWGKTSNYTLPMDKKYKLNYDPPKVTIVAFMVENGMQASRMVFLESEFNPFDDASWDETSSSTATGHFSDGNWTGGSSFSNNSSFGSGTWDN